MSRKYKRDQRSGVNAVVPEMKRQRAGHTLAMRADSFPDMTAARVLSPLNCRQRYASARTLGANEDIRLAADTALEDAGVFSLIQHSLEMGQSVGNEFMGYSALQNMMQNGLLRACIETVTDDMCRAWIELKHDGENAPDDGDLVKDIEKAIRRYDVQKVFHEALELVGYEGGAMIFLDTGAKGADLLTPLTLTPENAELKDGGLKRFTVIDPINCFPGRYNCSNPLAPDYFKPKTWYVLGQEVHASRLIRLVANECPLLLKPSYNFFGISQAQILWDYVLHFQTCRVSAADLMTKFSTTVFKTSMSDTLFAAGGEQQIARRLKMFTDNRSNGGIVAIDQETEDLVKIETPLAGVSDIVRQALEFLAALNRTPAVKLLGISPSGFNATGQSDITNYYDHIRSEQEKIMRSGVQKCLNALQITVRGRIDSGLTFDFAALSNEDKNTLAMYQQTRAGMMTTLLDRGVVSPEEVRKVLADDPDSGFNSIDPEDVPQQPDEMDDMIGGMGDETPPEKDSSAQTHDIIQEAQDGAPYGNKNAAGPHKKRSNAADEEHGRRVILPCQEYARVMSSIRTNYHARFAERVGKTCDIDVGEHHYRFINNGFDEFVVVRRKLIERRDKSAWSALKRAAKEQRGEHDE